MDFGGRKEVFRALVGSHNYNLNTPESDKDYKVFVAPTFDDLYFNNQFSKAYIGETADYDVHDIRKTSSLWWKANVNFLEVLFSEESEMNKRLNVDSKSYLTTMFRYRDDIAKMNLPYLYDACIGMHITKKKQIDKGTEGTQHLVDKYGFDTKQAMHSIRILDFLRRFADNDFEDFKGAIRYKDDEFGKRHLLDIKNGIYTKETYYEIASSILGIVENNYKELYKAQKPNEDTNQYLLMMVKGIVKNELF